MGSFFEQLLNHNDVVPILAITLSIGGCLIWMLAATIYHAVRVRAREQTKREVAAYVAEGTIDAQTAIAILNSGGIDGDEKRQRADTLFKAPKPVAV